MAQSSDWYMRNLQSLVAVFFVGILTFGFVFGIVYMRTRARFTAKKQQATTTSARSPSKSFVMHETPELVLIKSHTRLVRAFGFCGIVLQVVLLGYLVPVSGTKGSIVFAFSLFRPASCLVLYSLCFMTNTHAFFRLLMLVTCAGLVVLDTRSQVSLAMVADCLLNQELHCGQGALSLFTLHQILTLKRRDLANLVLNVVLMLEIGFLCVSIGFWKSRYSRRELSVSRPRLNVREALYHFFPSLAATKSNRATAQKHAGKATRPNTDLFAGLDRLVKRPVSTQSHS